MASINVKNQDEFNALSWQDKFGYMKENPNSVITNNEVLRVKQKLETDPTDSAKNYAAGITALRSGESLTDVLGDNFDKNTYGYQGASDNFKRDGQPTTPSAPAASPTSSGEGKGNVVAARDYINSISGNRGANYNIGFSNGFVTVNGRSLKPEYIENGVAYIKRRDIDGLLGSIDSERNRDSNRGILNENEIKWQEDFANSYDAVKNREPFSYSVKDDPIYREFEEYYLKQAEKDAKDIIANAGDNTYGVTNLGAIVAADALKRDREDSLAAYQKQFRDDAYNRYLDEIGLKKADLDLVRNLRTEDLERNWNIHRADIDDERYADEWDLKKQQYLQALEEGRINNEIAGRENELQGAVLADEFAKRTGWYPEWAKANYGYTDERDPYGYDDVQFARAIDQTNTEAALENYWKAKNKAVTGKKVSSTVTKDYKKKVENLVGYMNDYTTNNLETDLIERDASGNWRAINNGNLTVPQVIFLQNAINNNTELSDYEKQVFFNSLGISDSSLTNASYPKQATIN